MDVPVVSGSASTDQTQEAGAAQGRGGRAVLRLCTAPEGPPRGLGSCLVLQEQMPLMWWLRTVQMGSCFGSEVRDSVPGLKSRWATGGVPSAVSGGRPVPGLSQFLEAAPNRLLRAPPLLSKPAVPRFLDPL